MNQSDNKYNPTRREHVTPTGEAGCLWVEIRTEAGRRVLLPVARKAKGATNGNQEEARPEDADAHAEEKDVLGA